jgi:(1->4)-alpha-D-glucan 1-alpha-D-glucosylmutase
VKRIQPVPLPLAAIPRATYRVQLSRDFTFDDVTALVPYLAALGVSHVYCSPYLRARPGSSHGYDIVDHAMLNPEIGSRADFDRMVAALAREGMSHLCDVVPNHMAVMGGDNAWWMDVLANGPSSRYASFFDIDWNRHDPDLGGKVLVPVLGDAYAAVLERGELRLAFDADNGRLDLTYFEHRFPLDPKCYPDILLPAAAESRTTVARNAVAELESVAYTLKALPPRDDPSPARVAVRRRLVVELAQRLAALAQHDAGIRDAIEVSAARFNGKPGERESFDALHALLENQAFRLAHWRVASDEVNYRRFFDVNELAALRNEDAEVFAETHRFLLDLAAQGSIGGLRIDHPDGLYDPKRYFAALQAAYGERTDVNAGDVASRSGIYVVIEKIAAPHERLPESWRVHGTTGYRFANVVNGLFVDGRAKARLDRAWRAFVGDEAQSFEQASDAGRRAIMEGALATQLRVITLRALRLARADRRSRDFTFNALRQGLIEIVARFPVYRTYVDADGASAQDRRYVEWAVGRARARSRTSDRTVLDFLQRALLGEAAADASMQTVAAWRDFAMRAQQFSAPVAAKGVEDTALYRFNRLVSLNEVGGDPEQFGIGVRAFHGASADRAKRWPHTLLATSTHDNKRGEDVRARIDAISEMPAAWRAMVRKWRAMNRSHKALVDGALAPSANDEYLLYQTLVGSSGDDGDATARAAYRERITAYMRKAAREAKVHTSWLAPNAEYEAALEAFVAALLGDAGERLFLPDLRRECRAFAWFGQLTSVSATLLKLASPGVPDVYQGSELVDLSLVDPDNRRPVDYARRGACLAAIDAIAHATPGERGARLRALFDPPLDGRAKLFVIARALALRREHPALFAYGDYRPVRVSGRHAAHVVAFARRHEDQGVIAIGARLFASLGPAVGTLPVGACWSDTTLDLAFVPSGSAMLDVFGGTRTIANGNVLPLADAFADFPVALIHFRNAEA